jgi:hypothetical protein
MPYQSCRCARHLGSRAGRSFRALGLAPTCSAPPWPDDGLIVVKARAAWLCVVGASRAQVAVVLAMAASQSAAAARTAASRRYH